MSALRRRPFSACNKGNRRRLHAGKECAEKNCFLAQNMTADFRGKKCQTAKILSQAKFCVIFSGYMLLTGK